MNVLLKLDVGKIKIRKLKRGLIGTKFKKGSYKDK